MTNRERVELQMHIVERASNMGIIDMSFSTPKFTLLLDVSNVIPESCLEHLLNSSSENFTHDIQGIQQNFNRELKIMENCFVPRCCYK